MDHLKWRSHPSLAPPIIPYLCGDVEDTICDSIGKLQAWPSLMQWDLSNAVPILKSAQRCQSWLFFGLLRALNSISGRPFNTHNYVSQKSSRQILNTEKLPDFINDVSTKLFTPRWIPGALRAQRMTKDGHRLYTELSLTVPVFCQWAISVIREHEETSEVCDLWSSEVYGVFLSTLLLVEQVYDLAGIRGFIHNDQRIYLASFITSTRGLAESLSRIGQCPSNISRNRLLPSSACRLLTLPTNNGLEHSTCTTECCASFDVDNLSYVPKHTRGCHSRYCPMIDIMETVLCKIIARGAIPLVQSRIGPEDEVVVNIVDGTGIGDFVAISHVWAGGLGNFDANAHYQCQLRQIHDDLAKQASRRLSSTTIFYWLDTLCIPVLDKSLKAQAISSMVEIYARAETVLVIDPYLSVINSETMSIKEVDLAALCSPWMNRSWTFQEGALASQLVFRFADRLIPFEELEFKQSLMQQTSIQRLWSFGINVAHTAEYFLSSSRIFERTVERKGSHVDPNSKLFATWNELCKRSTSKPEDIAAIMAIFMDCNPTEILNLPQDQRMQVIVGTQTMLPADLLFAKVYSSSMWSPIPPNCRQRCAPLRPELGLMMSKQWGIFILPHLNFMRLLKPRQLGVDFEQNDIYDSGRKACCNIAFNNLPPKQRSKQKHSSVLLLREHNSNFRVSGRGVHFDLIRENENGMYLAYAGSFDYCYLDCTDGHHEPSCSASASNIFDPLDISVTQQRPLHLDMRIERTKLEWSSSRFYPVFIASIERDRLISTFRPIAAASWFAAYIYFCAQLGTLSRCYGFLPALFPVYTASIAFTLGRSYLLHFEIQYLRRLASDRVRQTVSSSFCSNHRTSSMLCHNAHIRVSVVLASIYVSLFLASATGTFAILRQTFTIRRWPGSSPFYDEFLYLVNSVLGEAVEHCRFSWIPVTFAKLVCKMVFFELFARLVFVALTAKNLLWDIQAVRIPHDKTYVKSLVRWRSDPKYLLMEASSRFFFTPFLVVYTVCLWIQQVKKEARWPTLSDIYNWCPLYSWTYNVINHVIRVYKIQVRRLMAYVQRCVRYLMRITMRFVQGLRRFSRWIFGRPQEESLVLSQG